MSPASATKRKPLLPLENGDRLTRREFERRYFAMPDVKKAELIEGVVHMGSPVSPEFHGEPHSQLNGWMFTYWLATPGIGVGDNGSFRLDKKNELQPDLAMYVRPEFGGRVQRGRKKLMNGAPELIAEIAASSASIDLNRKLKVYRRNQVHEYFVWRTYDEALDWFVLREGQYVPLQPHDGLLKSTVFPGLWLDAAALLKRDLAAVVAALQRGLATPEHAAFVERLASQRKA
jgi:Uma2 family endonuclease